MKNSSAVFLFFFIVTFVLKIGACQHGKKINNECKCDPGWYTATCEKSISNIMPWPYTITKWIIFSYYCILTLFSIWVLCKLIWTRLKSSPNAISNINFVYHIKVCWVISIMCVSVCLSAFMYDPIGEYISYSFSIFMFVLSIIFNQIVYTILFWHWSALYHLNESKIVNSDDNIDFKKLYSRHQRKSINDFKKSSPGKNKLTFILKGIVVGNIISILLLITGTIIWNVDESLHYTDAYSIFCCGYFLFLFILIHGSFIVHAPTLVKTIPVKNTEKYKLGKAAINIGIMGIIFIITWIISSLIFYTIAAEPTNIIIFFWFVNIPTGICLLAQLLLFFKKSNHFPLFIWGDGKSFSPKIKSIK